MELSAEEKKVLSGVTFHSEEIENGELCDEDKVILENMRAVKKYLEEKYSKYQFEITGCEPKEGTARDYDEWYYKVEGIDRDSAFIAMARDVDGKLEITDDFYGELIRKDAQGEISKLLKANGFSVVQVNVSFWEYFGDEDGQALDASKVLTGVIHAGNDIKIFLDGSGLSKDAFDGEVTKLENCLKKYDIKGDIYVVFLKDANGDIVRDRLYSDSFELE